DDRPGWNLLRDILRGDVAHLKVVTLDGDELGPLLEQRAAVISLEDEVVFDRISEHLHHVRADILLGKDGREAQLRLILRKDGEGCGSSDQSGADKKVTTRHMHCHCLLP